jgi:hypothetical protein
MSARPGADVPYPKATEARKPDTPGRARYKPSNHCAGNVGCPPLNLYARVRFLFPFCTRDRGCSAHPAFPAPSDFKARNFSVNLGRTAPRECETAFEWSLVIASAAKQSILSLRGEMDCFVASAPRNDGLRQNLRHHRAPAYADDRQRSATRQPDRLTPSLPSSIRAAPRPCRAS